MRPHAAWNVRTQRPRDFGPRRSSSRSLISPAALFVNVIARISLGFAPTALIRCATRYVRTRVLPEPAPAITSSGPSVASTASRWAGLRSARYCSGEATAIRPMLAAAPARARAAVPVVDRRRAPLPLSHRLRPSVRVALMIEGQEGVTWDDWVALAETCEANGVEALFRSDHYVSGAEESRPVLDAWATIAGLAARTTRLQLGTLVSPATFRHPAVLARRRETADGIC